MKALDSYRRIANLLKTGLAVILCLGALALGHVQTSSANIITVTSKLDTADPGKCRLRDAITAANNNTVAGGCPAGVLGMDTITFSLGNPCSLTQCTILLTDSLPIIAQDLTINGSPSNVAISGENLWPVFDLVHVRRNSFAGFRLSAGGRHRSI